jgi:hypothetical protein
MEKGRGERYVTNPLVGSRPYGLVNASHQLGIFGGLGDF